MSTDHLAVNTNEPTNESIVEEALPKPLYIRIARYISNILAPATVSIPFIVLVALYHTNNVGTALGFALLTIIFLSMGPLAYILIGVRMGKLSDVDVSRRSERAGPFLFGLLSALSGLLILMFMHGPKSLQTVVVLTLISGIVMLITTLWWKISIHASSLSGAVTVLTFLYGPIVLPAYLLVILVSWSRVVLHRHTIAQVIAGSLVSIALASGLLMITGV